MPLEIASDAGAVLETTSWSDCLLETAGAGTVVGEVSGDSETLGDGGLLEGWQATITTNNAAHPSSSSRRGRHWLAAGLHRAGGGGIGNLRIMPSYLGRLTLDRPPRGGSPDPPRQ